ncbi:hypothetical protein V8C26DRAFT_400660 [Trichoderma gracile]
MGIKPAHLFPARLLCPLARLMACNIRCSRSLGHVFPSIIKAESCMYGARDDAAANAIFRKEETRYGIVGLFFKDGLFTPSTCQNYWLLFVCQSESNGSIAAPYMRIHEKTLQSPCMGALAEGCMKLNTGM